MPQYLYNIDGQRHVFEGPDPRTTAQFAQRWAAAQASARAAAANDNRPQVGRRPSQFAMDIGARAKQDVADLTGAIDRAKAHPTDLLNGPRILSAVSRYVPNALGLAPAAGVDQVTGPVIRGINARFGTHFDPRYATDQILNAAGLLSGAPEIVDSENLLGRAVDQLPNGAIEADKLPELTPPKSTPRPTLAYTAPKVRGNVLGMNADRERVVPLSDGFVYNHQQRMKTLEGLPEYLQDAYRTPIEDHIISPVLDDPDYHGHNAVAIQNIVRELETLADRRRVWTGTSRVADALDEANKDFRIMVNQQQPKMARELGLDMVAGSPEDWQLSADLDSNKSDIPGELLRFEQYVKPPPPPPPSVGSKLNTNLDRYGEDIGDYLREVGRKWGPERIKQMLVGWKDIGETANDNTPPLNWAGRAPPRKGIDLPLAEDFDPPKPLRDTMSFPEKLAWMKTAANENGPTMPDEYLQNYLSELWVRLSAHPAWAAAQRALSCTRSGAPRIQTRQTRLPVRLPTRRRWSFRAAPAQRAGL